MIAVTNNNKTHRMYTYKQTHTYSTLHYEQQLNRHSHEEQTAECGHRRERWEDMTRMWTHHTDCTGLHVRTNICGGQKQTNKQTAKHATGKQTTHNIHVHLVQELQHNRMLWKKKGQTLVSAKLVIHVLVSGVLATLNAIGYHVYFYVGWWREQSAWI